MEIKSTLIANFCEYYDYSAEYILKGKGDMKGQARKSKEEKLIDLVGDLLDALLEIKPKWNDATSQLVHEAKKRKQ